MLEVCFPIWVWHVSVIGCLLCVWAYYAFLSSSGVFARIGVRIVYMVYMIEVCLPIWVWHAYVIGFLCGEVASLSLGQCFVTFVIAFFDFCLWLFGVSTTGLGFL
jgi:hypothetical protein